MKIKLAKLQDNKKRDKEIEVKGTIRNLEKYWEYVLISRSSICPKKHLFQADKQAPWQSPSKLLHDKKDARADNQKGLLVNVIKRC